MIGKGKDREGGIEEGREGSRERGGEGGKDRGREGEEERVEGMWLESKEPHQSEKVQLVGREKNTPDTYT